MTTEAPVSLASLEPGDAAVVIDIGGEGAFRRRLLDMGFTKGTIVRVIKPAPFGDPIEYCIGGTHVTLRKQEATQVSVEHVTRAPYCHRRGPGRHRGPGAGLRRGGAWRLRRRSR